MTDKTGGPAFPGVSKEYNSLGDPIFYHGMSLRDWFAGQALTDMTHAIESDEMITAMARVAYQIADAMLEERDK